MGGTNLVAQGEGGDAGLESARAAQQVAGHRLGGAYRYLVSVVAENFLDGQRFQAIVVRRRGAVGVDVADLFGKNLGVGKRRPHGAHGAIGGLIRLR